MADRWRKNHRYPGFDYAAPGSYFVTICLQAREPRFGSVSSVGEVSLTDAGRMVTELWNDLPNKFPGTALDAFIVMPDHVHGIVHIGANPENQSATALGQMMQWFKTMTTNRYIRGVREQRWAPFDRYFLAEELLRSYSAERAGARDTAAIHRGKSAALVSQAPGMSFRW